MPRPLDTDAIRTAVRASGLRATPSRIAVLELLRASDTPLSHGEVVALLGPGASCRPRE